MRKKLRKLLIVVLAITMVFGSFANAFATEVVSNPFADTQEEMICYNTQDECVYEVTRDGVEARVSPYADAETFAVLDAGMYCKGVSVLNDLGHEWIKCEEVGFVYYVYPGNGNLTEHQHQYCLDVVNADTGYTIGTCDCGFGMISDGTSQAEIDFTEYLRDVVLGEYSGSSSWTALVTSVVCGFVPVLAEVMDVRDISYEVKECIEGRCDGVGVVLNSIAFIPGLDIVRAAKHGDELRAVKALDGNAEEINNNLAETARRELNETGHIKEADRAVKTAYNFTRGKKLAEGVVYKKSLVMHKHIIPTHGMSATIPGKDHFLTDDKGEIENLMYATLESFDEMYYDIPAQRYIYVKHWGDRVVGTNNGGPRYSTRAVLQDGSSLLVSGFPSGETLKVSDSRIQLLP